jgi:hypothetical protein
VSLAVALAALAVGCDDGEAGNSGPAEDAGDRVRDADLTDAAPLPEDAESSMQDAAPPLADAAAPDPDATPTDPDAAADAALPSPDVSVDAAPVDPDRVTVEIGPGGGEVLSLDARLRVIIPPGALEEAVEVWVSPRTQAALDAGDLPFEAGYEIGPDQPLGAPARVIYTPDEIVLDAEGERSLRVRRLLDADRPTRALRDAVTVADSGAPASVATRLDALGVRVVATTPRATVTITAPPGQSRVGDLFRWGAAVMLGGSAHFSDRSLRPLVPSWPWTREPLVGDARLQGFGYACLSEGEATLAATIELTFLGDAPVRRHRVEVEYGLSCVGGMLPPIPDPAVHPLPALRLPETIDRLHPDFPNGAAGLGCPTVMVAGTGGTVVHDACTGAAVTAYGEERARFAALGLPRPADAEGEGAHALVETGTSRVLTALDDDGRALGNADREVVDDLDLVPIGGAPQNGALFLRAAPIRAERIVWDGLRFAAGGVLAGEEILPVATRSVFSDRAGEVLLAVEAGSPSTLWRIRTDRADPALPESGPVGMLGDFARRVRCDLSSGVCAVSNFDSDTVTLLAWDGAGVPEILETVDVAAGPIGLDVSGDQVVVAGFYDGRVAVIRRDAEGMPVVDFHELPEGCASPTHAVFLRDRFDSVAVSCQGSAAFVWMPGIGAP